jgi:hypothetical protein
LTFLVLFQAGGIPADWRTILVKGIKQLKGIYNILTGGPINPIKNFFSGLAEAFQIYHEMERQQ